MKTRLRALCNVILAGIVILLAFTTTQAVRTSASTVVDHPYQLFLPYVDGKDYWSLVDPTGQTVTFWHNHTGDREDGLGEIIDGFNTTNPWDITVIPSYQGSYDDIYVKMLAVLNTEAAPDLVVAYQNQAATYQLSDALVDMTPLVEGAAWGLTQAEIDDFFPGFWDQDISSLFGGARLGFPPNRSMEVLYYNLDWIKELGFTAPPATPAEFRAMACAAVTHPFSGGSGGESLGYMLSMDASRFASWTFAFGGDIYNPLTNQYTYNSQAAVDAMTFLQALFADGCAAFVTELYEDQTDFAAGDLLFSIGSSSAISVYRSAVEAGAQFDWNVGAIGHTTPDPVMNIYGASISMPRHTPESELAAWLFLKYFTSPDVQVQWVYVSSYFPVRQSTAEALDAYFAFEPQYATAFELLPYAKAEPNTPYYDSVRSWVVEAMMDIMNGADVALTLNALNNDANTTLP